jgi:DNA polymerase-3 subunit alpha
MSNNFVNLRVRSHFSISQSVISIDRLFNKINEFGHGAVGLCDDNFFGAFQFCQKALKLGIKPILGIQLPVEDIGFLSIFIKSNRGYRSVSHLVSLLAIYEKPQASIEDLEKLEDVVVLSGDRSIFYENLDDSCRDYLKRLKNLFPGDFFIELVPYLNYGPLLPLAKDLNIPVVVTVPAIMCSETEKQSIYALRTIEQGRFYDTQEMENQESHSRLRKNLDFPIEEALKNTWIIAKKCSFALKNSPPIIPKFCEDENSEFRRQSLAKLEEKFIQDNIHQEKHQVYRDRLEYELDILVNKNFAGYFLVTADFVSFAKNNGIPVGPGRGSGAGSLAAYVLGITDVDPIAFDLMFERFLNPQRTSLPDFDIDFCNLGRSRVIDYLRERYGKYNVVNIITFGTFKARGLIQAVCKIFRIPFTEATKISKLVPFNQVRPVTLAEALDMVPELRRYQETYPQVFEICLQLGGAPRNISKHAAGIIISNKPIYEQCPLYRDKQGDLVTQLNFIDIERVGGVKFDFLGLKTLTLLKKLSDLTGIDYRKIPLNDEATFKLFCSLKLEGVFQFEGGGMRNVIGKLGPDVIDDLIAINALFRPGPMANIPAYIRGKKNPESVEYAHPLLRPILEPTFGIIVYQEQVMAIACELGGYTLAEADILRRIMGKKKFEKMKEHRIKFIDGCKVRGVDRGIAESLFDLMSEFASYAFNKAHATAYSIIGYYCGYFKTHYTLEFLACCMYVESDNREKVCRYISEAKLLGYEILSPNINKSLEDHSIIVKEDGTKALLLGLCALKNTNKKLNKHLVAQRIASGPYSSPQNFIHRNLDYINKKSWEALVCSGALSCWGDTQILIENFQRLRRGERMSPAETPSNFQAEQLGLGFYVNHPTRLLHDKKLHNAKSLQKATENIDEGWIAGSVLKYTMRSGKSRKSFGILELQDHSGLIDITLFGAASESKLIKAGGLLMVKIRLQSGIINRVTGLDLMTLDEYLERNRNILLYSDSNKKTQLIHDLCEKHPGNCSVDVLLGGAKLMETKLKIKDSIQFRHLAERGGILTYSPK